MAVRAAAWVLVLWVRGVQQGDQAGRAAWELEGQYHEHHEVLVHAVSAVSRSVNVCEYVNIHCEYRTREL